MAVCNVSRRNLGKDSFDLLVLLCLSHLPYPVTNTVLGHKIIQRSLQHHLLHDLSQYLILTICQENGTCLGIHHIHMADPILLLLFPGVLVLLDHAADIIVNRTTGHDSSLAPPIHSQLI